jgi:ribosomal protein S18 acetylase RimI-like enzyme
MDCSKDVRLDAEGALFYFSYLEWDSVFFARRCFCLNCDMSVLKPAAEIKKQLIERLGGSFISAKIDTSCDKCLLDFMQEAGFRYIGTEVVLKYCGSPGRVSDITIEKLMRNENLPYEALGASFSFTRFHSDPRISEGQADALWTAYIRNYKLSPSHHMLIARYKGEIAGAVLICEDMNHAVAYLYFVAVLEEYRGKGIGSALVRHAARMFATSDLMTGTQIKNVPAMNFYIKNGFSSVHATRTVLHRWSN